MLANTGFTLADITFLCGLVTSIAAVLTIYKNGKNEKNKPNEIQDKRISDLEKRCDRYDTIFEKDKKDIEEIKEGFHLILKTEFALLQHGLDGNNIEPMKKAQEDIQNYLINK